MVRFLPALISAILISCVCDKCMGSVIGLWEFNDTPGTSLVDTLNEGSSAPENWTSNILNSTTASTSLGKGVYRLRRSGGVDPDGNLIGATSLVRIGSFEEGRIRYTAVIDNFNFTGTGGSDTGFQGLERVRFELLHDAFPSTTARMILQRVRDPATGLSTIFLSGEALSVSSLSTNIPGTPIYSGASSSDPLALQLDVNLDTDVYSVSYAFGSSSLTTIGAGLIDPLRTATYGRLTAFRKLDSTPDEQIDIDSIRIDVVPEPTFPPLPLLCCVALLAIHSKRTWTT